MRSGDAERRWGAVVTAGVGPRPPLSPSLRIAGITADARSARNGLARYAQLVVVSVKVSQAAGELSEWLALPKAGRSCIMTRRSCTSDCRPCAAAA